MLDRSALKCLNDLNTVINIDPFIRELDYNSLLFITNRIQMIPYECPTEVLCL